MSLQVGVQDMGWRPGYGIEAFDCSAEVFIRIRLARQGWANEDARRW